MAAFLSSLPCSGSLPSVLYLIEYVWTIPLSFQCFPDAYRQLRWASDRSRQFGLLRAVRVGGRGEQNPAVELSRKNNNQGRQIFTKWFPTMELIIGGLAASEANRGAVDNSLYRLSSVFNSSATWNFSVVSDSEAANIDG